MAHKGSASKGTLSYTEVFEKRAEFSVPVSAGTWIRTNVPNKKPNLSSILYFFQLRESTFFFGYGISFWLFVINEFSILFLYDGVCVR